MTYDTRPGYGAGRSHFLESRERERAGELGLFREEKATAEDRIQYEAEQEGFLSFVFGVFGAISGFVIGAEVGQPWKGAAIGWKAGTEGGKWIQHIGSDYESEDYHVTTDTGKWDVQQKGDLEDFNRALDAQQSAEFWDDVTGTGKSLLSMFYLSQAGGANPEDPSELTGVDLVSERQALWQEANPTWDPGTSTFTDFWDDPTSESIFKGIWIPGWQGSSILGDPNYTGKPGSGQLGGG